VGSYQPLVSVIIPSFNHAQFLRECVDSVLDQDYPRIEVIVVDDGSMDGSLQLLQSYGDRIKLLRQEGGRQARARNLGLTVASGELIAFLDSDDRYLPGRITAAVDVFENDSAAGVVWADYCTIDAQGRSIAKQHWHPLGSDFRRTLIAGNPICNATVTVRRQLLDEIGGFDERAPRVCDGAAWYQIAARGHRFVHIDLLVLEYRIHGHNDSARFAPMTHDRDLALLAAAQSYCRLGVLTSRSDLLWLRRALVRQFAFRAAAWVQRLLSSDWGSATRARGYELLGSDAGLRLFALLKTLKETRG
jgi:glycosyltransferase involved in cell wall biosynthesis